MRARRALRRLRDEAAALAPAAWSPDDPVTCPRCGAVLRSGAGRIDDRWMRNGCIAKPPLPASCRGMDP